MKRKISINSQPEKVKISKIESTNEKLTSRGGLFFLNEYLENIGIISRLSHKFKYLKDSRKGLSVENYFKQLFSFIFDGTKLNLTYFDELKKDESYSELLNLNMDDLATSHQIKRLTGKFRNESRQIDAGIRINTMLQNNRINTCLDGLVDIGLPGPDQTSQSCL